MECKAKAYWTGNLREGVGTIVTPSGILENASYSYNSRLENTNKGTSPQELLAAAQAGCFAVAVADALTQKGLNPIVLNTEATLSVKDSRIAEIHLSVTACVDGITAEEFKELTIDAEKNCMISRGLNVPISSECHFCI